MAFQRRTKHKTVKKRVNLRKNIIAIKKRLIEISIRVDGYIYRNKAITVEEAEKYLNEISIHQTRCNKDVHILQVTEKLTRCLKIIIEETKTKILTCYNVTTTGNDQAIDVFPSFSNNDNLLIDDSLPAAKEAVNKNKDQKSNFDDAIIISDSTDDDDKENGDKYTDTQIFSEPKSSTCNTHEKEKTVKFAEATNSNNLKRGSNIINIENNIHSNPGESYDNIIARTPNESMEKNGNLTLANTKKKRKYKKRNNIPKENSQETCKRSIKKRKGRNTKKKNVSEDTQLSPRCPPLNKTSNTSSPTDTKITPKKSKTLAPKKKSNKNVHSTSNKRKSNKNLTNKNPTAYTFKERDIASVSCISGPNNPKHTYIDVIGDEVSLPFPNTTNTEESSTISNPESVAKKMGVLTIDNEIPFNDLSWVQHIRYVREVSTDEFEPTPSGFNGTFWNNLSAPIDLTDIDFLS